MKYRLKDRELQKKLDDISNGDFTQKMNKIRNIRKSVRICFGEEIDEIFTYSVSAEGKFSIILTKNEIEEIVEYNPRKWNEFMKVTPPTNVLMRVEIQEPGRPKPIKTSGTYDGSRWSFFAHGYCSPCDIRFRPWDDEDEK